MDLVLIRHGRTAWNASHRFLGQTDVPLDAEGEAQVRALAATRPFGPVSEVVSSPLRRAWFTAAALSEQVRPVDALRELHQGELEGLSVADARARWPTFFAAWATDPTEVPVPGGESLGACRDRAWEALVALAERSSGPRVAVVSHQLVLSSVQATVHGEPLARWRSFSLPNAGWAVIRWDGRSLVPAPGDGGGPQR